MATSRKQGAARQKHLALSRDRIVEAALALIADEGLSAFSTRKLGERLGCEAMSIYHHFPSKQRLLDALVEHAIGTVDVPEPGPDALTRVRRSLYSYRAMARRFPALFPLVAVHRLNTPAGVRFIESILRLIRSLEPDPELAARQFRVVGYYLIGAGLEETAGYARGPSAAEPVSDEFVARECPCLIEAAPYFQQHHWDATFDLGIELLIAGMVQSGEQRGLGRPV
ncbi:MAG: TetR/AcrR family transcriptional regulator [Betaproteobacteria bacterium]|nr:MAG: TetR/AcrR family transcriptional regulator [Betaproteobacteria bacterium]